MRGVGHVQVGHSQPPSRCHPTALCPLHITECLGWVPLGGRTYPVESRSGIGLSLMNLQAGGGWVVTGATSLQLPYLLFKAISIRLTALVYFNLFLNISLDSSLCFLRKAYPSSAFQRPWFIVCSGTNYHSTVVCSS